VEDESEESEEEREFQDSYSDSENAKKAARRKSVEDESEEEGGDSDNENEQMLSPPGDGAMPLFHDDDLPSEDSFSDPKIPGHQWQCLKHLKATHKKWANVEMQGLFPRPHAGPIELKPSDVILGKSTLIKNIRIRQSNKRFSSSIERATSVWTIKGWKSKGKVSEAVENPTYNCLESKRILFMIMFYTKYWIPKNPRYVKGANDVYDRTKYITTRFVEEVKGTWREASLPSVMSVIVARFSRARFE